MIALLVAAIFLIALPHAEKQVAQHLEKLGYNNIAFEQTQLSLTGLSFKIIQLDTDGFNKIEGLDATLYWPRYLLERKIDHLQINKIHLSFVQKDFQRALRRFVKIKDFTSLPSNNIKINAVQIDLSAGRKALRFKGDLQIIHEDGQHKLNANLSGNQYDVAFDSQWTGLIDKQNQALEIDGIFNDIKVKTPIVEINRGSGWLSYHAKEEDDILSAQFDAGSGKISDIPANNISLILGQNQGFYPLLLRSQISGLENTYLTADYNYHPIVEKRTFQSSLHIDSPNDFLSLLQSLKIIDKTVTLSDNQALQIAFLYDAEKRFPAGPLPFQLSDNKNTQGTILIYPDSHEVRGTIQSDIEFIDSIQTIFDIPKQDINDNVIRLDRNIQSLLN